VIEIPEPSHPSPARALKDYVIYELHTGTFTREGTFTAAIAQLDRVVDLGITAVELMPVAQFPGTRNWGYDGVLPFAVQNSYGGPQGLRAFIDACHERGLSVVLDVVYNHLGPEGNYLREFGPYFSDVYRTPWGEAINFDGPDSDPVRHYFIENALMWLDDYGVDALRLDAVQAILDCSPFPFLAELAAKVKEVARARDRDLFLIAETDTNDPKLIVPADKGGIGLDAVWADDLHHALHLRLTGETRGYYVDYQTPQTLADALASGFAYTGQYSQFRRRLHGAPPWGIEPEQFVVAAQTHDQVGNRMLGERLSQLTSYSGLKLAAALVLLSSHVPLLFMGEEYGETRPFLYFVSHSDPQLVEAVRRGRKQEFAGFGWNEEPPDPQAEHSFARCILDPAAGNPAITDLYRALIGLRSKLPLREIVNVELDAEDRLLVVVLGQGSRRTILAFNLGETPIEGFVPTGGGGPGRWFRWIDAEQEPWGTGGVSLPTELTPADQLRLTLGGHGFVAISRIASAGS
jgi:maltooligosyltrehalose trehalohydrolase